MKLSMKRFKIRNSIFIYSSLFLIFLGFIFQGCENDFESIERDNSVFLSINGDLNNPETFMVPGNTRIYLEASERMIQYVQVINDRITWNINNGDEINISENIFDYMTDWFVQVNTLVDEKSAKVYLDKKGGIRIIRINSDDSVLDKKVRLKSGNECSSYDFSQMTEQEQLEALIDLYSCGANGYMGDYIDLSTINWNIDNNQEARYSGSGTYNGMDAIFSISDCCYGMNDPCYYNDICEIVSHDYPDYTQFAFLGSTHNAIIGITIWK